MNPLGSKGDGLIHPGWWIGIGLSVVLICAANWYFLLVFVPDQSATSQLPAWEQRAAFGSMFGAVNALFAGLAFAGLIYTILLQRAELKATRIELARAAKAQETQVYLAALSAALTAEAARLQAYSENSGGHDQAMAQIERLRKEVMEVREREGEA